MKDFSKLTTGQRYDLLTDSDFIESFADYADEDFDLARDVLGLPTEPDRATRCVRPVVLDKTNLETGETSLLTLPCGTSNALLCASCAEFSARLRTRQIMNGLETAGTQTALFTLTAPSFGQVHRSSYSVKDEFKARKMTPSQKHKNRLSVMQMKGKCPCGQAHDYLDSKIGCPIKDYEYAQEIIFNENLPALVKATIKDLKRRADSLGISKEDFSVFGVYERQKRGSLHGHFLVCVRNNRYAFSLLIADLKSTWKSPVSAIPENRVNWYESLDCTKRWFTRGVLNSRPPALSIPRLSWKGKKDVAAVQWGEIYDVRILVSEQNEESSKITGYAQAAHYLSKYLTKNQAAFSQVALDSLDSFSLENHYSRFRTAAIAICGDRVIAEVMHDAALREFSEFCDSMPDDDSELEEEQASRLGELYLEKQKALKHWKLASTHVKQSDVFNLIFPNDFAWNLDNRTAKLATRVTGIFSASRSLVIRLNKMMNNAGFTGSLTSASNWGTSLADLKAEMSEWALKNNVYVADPAEYVYELNFKQMLELLKDRRRKALPKPVYGVEAVFETGLAERPKLGGQQSYAKIKSVPWTKFLS